MGEVNTSYIYASVVTDGEFIDSQEWDGILDTYKVEFYLTGPLNVNTQNDLRYGYALSGDEASTLRDGFPSVDDAEKHARLVMRAHDAKASHMEAPF
jgi:hypothetical protein